MAFLALEKNRKRFPANDQRDYSRSCSLNRETLAVQSKPEGAVETVSLKMNQFLSLLRQDLGEI